MKTLFITAVLILTILGGLSLLEATQNIRDKNLQTITEIMEQTK